jgi:hypothetical protein
VRHERRHGDRRVARRASLVPTVRARHGRRRRVDVDRRLRRAHGRRERGAREPVRDARKVLIEPLARDLLEARAEHIRHDHGRREGEEEHAGLGLRQVQGDVGRAEHGEQDEDGVSRRELDQRLAVAIELCERSTQLGTLYEGERRVGGVPSSGCNTFAKFALGGPATGDGARYAPAAPTPGGLGTCKCSTFCGSGHGEGGFSMDADTLREMVEYQGASRPTVGAEAFRRRHPALPHMARALM